jgi:hypothetical protein
MSLAEATIWSLARSLIIAGVAWPLCCSQVRWLKTQPGRRRHWTWWLLLIPFLLPELWAGYAWRGFAIRLAADSFWNWLPATWCSTPLAKLRRDALVDEFLADLLLLARAIPVGTVALYFAPPAAISSIATHCWRLVTPTGVSAAHRDQRELARRRIGLGKISRFRWDALLRQLPALALMFLVTFQEFELVSLMQRPAWTVWLFDAQVGGLLLEESVRMTIRPVVCQLAILLPLAGWAAGKRSLSMSPAESRPTMSRYEPVIVWGMMAVAGAFLVVIPAIQLGQGVLGGFARVLSSPLEMRMLLREVGIGSLYATLAAAAASGIASVFIRWSQHRPWRKWIVVLLVLPGCLGSLVLGLCLVHVFQWPYLRWFYRTPLSFAVGLTMGLLPRALLLRFLLNSVPWRIPEQVAILTRHARQAGLCLKSLELAWQLRWRREFWGVALLAYWSFFDLTSASLLSPVTIVTAPLKLYNLMHYGRNATLTALVWLTVLLPIGVCVVVAQSRRLVFRWFWR